MPNVGAASRSSVATRRSRSSFAVTGWSSSTASRPTAFDRACARLSDAVADLALPLPYLPTPPPGDDLSALPEVRRRTPFDQYAASVEAAREHIFAGDIFQVVLAQRFDLVGEYDPF